MDKWALHFQDMVLNKLSHKEVYIVSDANQVGNGDIKIVSPTEQAVEQAKSSLKRKLIINPPSKVKKKNKKSPQSGRGRRKGKKSMKKRK